ncbi:MAG: hypothetical protein LBQ84_06915 [Flavobacteriaceae bacterium]|jgi:hypothetical protein|nr:hypothetical protein [Flavobacteriaceae bacterium]
MKNSLEIRIDKLKERGYELPLSKILEDSFTIWKKIIFYGIFYILFSYLFNNLVTTFFSNILGTHSIDSEFSESIMRLSEDPYAFQKMVSQFQEYINNPLIIKKTLLSSLVSLLIYPMGAGVIFCAYQADKNGAASFKDLFKGFQGNKFLNLIGLTLVFTIVMIISMFLLFIPAIYLTPAFILAGAFIVIDDVPLLQAVKSSFQVVNIRFRQVLLILIISFLISKVLGFLLCIIGLIFTLPFSFAVVYSIYKNTLGTVETTVEYSTINEPCAND